MKRIDISTGAVILLSVLYFFGGISLLTMLFVPVCVHELGHIAALRCFGAKGRSLRFDMTGLCISYGGLKNRIEEFVCLLCGPASGLALALLLSYFGNGLGNDFLLAVSGFSLLLSVYNLLPALPLDGGRMLLCLLTALFEEAKARKIAERLSLAVGALLALFGAFRMELAWGSAVCVAGIMILLSQFESDRLL